MMERRDDACPSRLDSIRLFPSRENTSRERDNNNSGLLRNLLRFVSSRDDATGKRAAFPLIVPRDKSRISARRRDADRIERYIIRLKIIVCYLGITEPMYKRSPDGDLSFSPCAFFRLRNYVKLHRRATRPRSRSISTRPGLESR